MLASNAPPRPVLLPLTLVLGLTSCGGDSPEVAALRHHASAAAATAAGLEALAQTTDALGGALAIDSTPDATIDARLAEHEAALADLEAALGDLERAEADLDAAYYGPAPGVTRASLAAPVAFLLGLAAFAVTMQQLNERMNAQRAARDAADREEDFEAYQAARREMANIGVEATEQLARKIIPSATDPALSAVPLGQLTINTRNAIQDLTVLWGTRACATTPEAEACRAGATSVRDGDSIPVPAGELQVVVTAADRAREVVDDVPIAEDEIATFVVDLLEVATLASGNADFTHCLEEPGDPNGYQCFASPEPMATQQTCRGAFLSTVEFGPCPAGGSACIEPDGLVSVYYEFPDHLSHVLDGLARGCESAGGRWESSYSP